MTGTATPPSPSDAEPTRELDEDAWALVERLGRYVHVKEADLPATLDAILLIVSELIEPADFVGLNLYARGVFTPQAVLGEAPPLLDQLQQRTGTGPCIDASREQVVVRVDDLRVDTRWPEYAELAVSKGVLAMLCLPLWVDDVRLGSLSLYSRQVAPFDARAERRAALVATQAALALADAQRTDNLRTALGNRDVIGQAKGVLMERHRITAEQAFQLLSEASQRANRKLVAVAEDLVQTGELPGVALPF